jgi:hypothetical protein
MLLVPCTSSMLTSLIVVLHGDSGSVAPLDTSPFALVSFSFDRYVREQFLLSTTCLVIHPWSSFCSQVVRHAFP